ncbi:MAG: hypothetical protein ACPGID_10340, partial [Rubricella sp.]
ASREEGFRFRPGIAEPGAEVVLGRRYGGAPRARLDEVTAALDVVEAMMPDEGWCSGTDQPHGPDIAAVIAIDFVVNQHLHLVEGRYPKLHRLTEASHAIPAFAKTRPGA